MNVCNWNSRLRVNERRVRVRTRRTRTCRSPSPHLPSRSRCLGSCTWVETKTHTALPTPRYLGLSRAPRSNRHSLLGRYQTILAFVRVCFHLSSFGVGYVAHLSDLEVALCSSDLRAISLLLFEKRGRMLNQRMRGRNRRGLRGGRVSC